MGQDYRKTARWSDYLRRAIYDQNSDQNGKSGMETVSLAEAKAHLSQLIDKVESGEEIVITRHGRPVARVTAAEQPKKPLDLDALAEFRKTVPPLRKPAAELVREMRDEERY